MGAPENQAFLRISRRAESAAPATLVQTFVDAGPLFTLLSSRDHQIMYGRRGTGKTHALVYLAQSREAGGDLPIYVDLRQMGSTGGIYADPNLPLPERATRLLIDTLQAIHEALLDQAIKRSEELNLAVVGPILDDLAGSISEVTVVGAVAVESQQGSTTTRARQSDLSADVSLAGVSARVGQTDSGSSQVEDREIRRQQGDLRYRVQFGRVGRVLRRLAEALGRHIWLLLDEWSDVPIELQPYLADLLRRSVFPTQGITVKLGAIEQRSSFQIRGERGDYIGIELGADATADVNLDDFMVFDNDPRRAVAFFRELIFKHYVAAVGQIGGAPLPNSNALVTTAFTQQPTFDEFVRSAEGVPRDAINILSLCAQRAGDASIAIEHVRAAAKVWYQRDKDASVSAKPAAKDLLHWIIQEVISHRRARAFLIRSGTRHDLIDFLFDSRVLHLLKRSVSAHDTPGIRYEVYKIDYGCYVDLITTARDPQGLLPKGDEDDGEFVDVPPDDYRAIRRAILDVSQFSQA